MQNITKESLVLKVIKYFPIIFILISSILTTLYISYNYNKTLENEKEEIEKNYIEFNKNLIHNNIDIIHKYIYSKNHNSNDLLKEKVKEHIYVAYDIMTSIYEEYKDTKRKEEIIELIKIALDNVRFDNGRGYFSIHTMEGINILQPINKKVEGTSVFYRQDIMGDYPIQKAINIAKTKGEGFLFWYYYKPDDISKEYQKIGIVKKFEPYNLIITTAEYVSDFGNHVKKEALEYIKNLKYLNKESIFVIDQKANFLLTQTDYTNLSDIDKNNPFVQSYTELINSQKEDIYSQYEYMYKDKNSIEKISYLKKVDIYGWVIGTGFNLDNLDLKIKNRHNELEIAYDKQINLVLIIAIVVTLIFLIISTFMSGIIEKRFFDYKESLEKQLKENEIQLIKNQKQKEILLRAQEVAHIGDWKLNLQTNKFFWSDEVIRILGMGKEKKEDFSPDLLRNIIIEEDISDLVNSLKACINTGTEHKAIYRIRRPNNEIRWIDCRGKLNNDKLSIIGTIQDITENKILELEKQQRDELFYQQSKMAAMGEMIGNIAHQWRQPLSVISTASTGLKLQKEMDILSDENFYSTLVAINNSAQHLSTTIDDFRDFFNPSNNNINEFNITDTFSKTLNLLNAQFVAKDIKIIQNIEEYKVSSIENELIQVLINILNNARDALLIIENQSKFIFINAYKKDNSLIIEIKDNAGGIQEDIMDRIFEPYFTTKHKAQGTGIGLYMSKEIVEKHLDGILLVSNENYTYENVDYIGAKFTIEISDLEVKA